MFKRKMKNTDRTEDLLDTIRELIRDLPKSDYRTEKAYLEIGNCFRTREEAELAAQKLKALKRLRDAGLKVTGMQDEIFEIDLADFYSGWRRDASIVFGGGRPVCSDSEETPYTGEE